MNLLTTYRGVIHRDNCHIVRSLAVSAWKWRPELDGPGVARACKVCLGGVLPGGAS